MGDLPYIEQRVLFVTDRNYQPEGNPKRPFGTDQRDKLSYGCADVTLPLNREPGSNVANNAPWLSGWFNTQERYHVSLDPSNIKVFSATTQDGGGKGEFLAEVKEAIKQSAKQELVLYIHGYNTRFPDTVKTAALLAVDTEQPHLASGGDPGGPNYGPRAALAFDWASCGWWASYAYVPWEDDLERAQVASEHLAELLTDLAGVLNKQGCCRGIHVICHSMGNYVLHKALTQVVERAGSHRFAIEAASDFFDNIKSIVFAAPDISRPNMMAMIKTLEVNATKGRQEVLYCCSKDRVLAASSLLRWIGDDRAGRAGVFTKTPRHTHPFTAPDRGLETVDASDEVRGILGHGYFTGKGVLHDIGHIMNSKTTQRDDITQMSTGCATCDKNVHRLHVRAL